MSVATWNRWRGEDWPESSRVPVGPDFRFVENLIGPVNAAFKRPAKGRIERVVRWPRSSCQRATGGNSAARNGNVMVRIRKVER